MDGSDPVTEKEWRQRRRDPEDELDGGESLNQLYERVRTTFGGIRSQHSSGAISLHRWPFPYESNGFSELLWSNPAEGHLDPAAKEVSDELNSTRKIHHACGK